MDTQTVLGAIAAYLMVGMSFAFVYQALDALQAGPFIGSQGEGPSPQDPFFAFTTLTTTGTATWSRTPTRGRPSPSWRC
ncbi:MAG TPA: hypothetical protein VF468_31220 [Actinomycetota bacterium]|nr:hypothetical protein [Actinomycetota bacterium]